MKKKIFLTSMLVLSFACPAMAEDGNEFIENGDTCNIDNLGTSTNNDTANIEAIWNLVSVPCSAGQYFNASTASCETCSAGSWCVAGTYDVENNQTGAGSTLCSTLANGEYTLSADGSSENTQCYRNCSTSDVEHSAEVSGGYYYGDNNQCVPTSCAAGWHVNQGGVDLNDLFVNINSTNSSWGYINNDGSFSDLRGHEQSYYNLATTNTWASNWPVSGITLKGNARCSSRAGAQGTWTNLGYATRYNLDIEGNVIDNLPDETGNYCYCQLTAYKTSDMSSFVDQYSLWVFVRGPNDGYGNSYNCIDWCPGSCATNFTSNNQFRQAVLNAFPEPGHVCDGNDVSFDLYNDSVSNNGSKVGEGSCTYGGHVGSTTTPTKPGYRFKGWKLRNSNNNNNQ